MSLSSSSVSDCLLKDWIVSTEDNDAELTKMIWSKQPCQIVAESADAVLEVFSAVTVNESVLMSSEAVTVIIDDGISDTVDCTSNAEYSEE